jgi:hypothetical protein
MAQLNQLAHAQRRPKTALVRSHADALRERWGQQAQDPAGSAI